MEACIQVVTTTEKRQDVEKIAKALVERRLAACAQILGPIVSTYWWKDNIETVEEWQCLIKSKKSFYGKIEKAIKMLHPYETPEIIALPIVSGSDDYLKWLNDQLK
jgi:periplasmic divalent cation tolerance protein